MARICIVTGAHLCRNPRVVKEADALARAGFRVTVVGPILSAELALVDEEIRRAASWEYRPAVDLRRPGSRLIARVVRRAGCELVARFDRPNPYALGYGMAATLRLARAERAELYIGHQEVGLWVVDRLAREGHRVGVDFEDWYSEDLLPEARVQRPLALLRLLEEAAMRRGGHVTTTSEALARELAHEFEASAPAVLYNGFPWADRSQLDGRIMDRKSLERPSLHWVSQTIGPGRGLEQLFTALRQVPVPVEVHLRGACSAGEAARLRSLFPYRSGHELFLHGLVPPGELLSRIAEHDIGLALELEEPRSTYLTVSNKILHYLLAGTAVIATATDGQREVARAAPHAVRLCRDGEVESMAREITDLVGVAGSLRAAKAAALEAARTRFSWEAQVPVLLDSVERALSMSAAQAGYHTIPAS